MTRAEAIKIIDCYDIGFYDLSGEKITADKLADAFDMAIEALQTPPISQRSMYQAGYRQAQEDRPRGEWIKDSLGTVICSECKRPRRDNRVNHINFCNSCGAQMKGADDE